MDNTIAFVTNQYRCDRLIYAAREVADQTKTDLIIIEVLDSEYKLNPPAVDYLFKLSKNNKATMRMLFSDNKIQSILEAVSHYDCKYIVTGMPGSNGSILYDLWKRFPEKEFFSVDANGMLIEVASEARRESVVHINSAKPCLA